MKKVLNIAVFGLSLGILDQLKKQVLSILPRQTQVNWVNIAEQQIDLIIVNDTFFHSSTIQKIIIQQRTNYLRLVKSVDSHHQLNEDTLFYPIFQLELLREWFHKKFFYCDVYQPLKTPFYDAEVTDIISVIQKCLIPSNGFIQLFDSRGMIALVDTSTKRVWTNHTISTFNKSLNQTYATNHFVQDISYQYPCQDLHNWLWNICFNSTELQFTTVKPTQYFKLEVWPQPQSSHNRRDLMKIAACFEKGAQLQTVADQLQIPFEHISRFVGVCLELQLGSLIESHLAEFHPRDQTKRIGRMTQLLGVLSKLRKSLWH